MVCCLNGDLNSGQFVHYFLALWVIGTGHLNNGSSKYQTLQYSNGWYSDPHCVWNGFSNCHVNTGLLKVLRIQMVFVDDEVRSYMLVQGYILLPSWHFYETNKHWILEQKHRHKRSEQLCYANVSNVNITRYSLFLLSRFLDLTWNSSLAYNNFNVLEFFTSVEEF